MNELICLSQLCRHSLCLLISVLSHNIPFNLLAYVMLTNTSMNLYAYIIKLLIK